VSRHLVKLVDDRLDALDAAQQRHAWVAFVVAVVKKYGDDRGSSLAALITYYAFLAVLPLFLVFVTVLGFVLDGHPGLRHDLVDSALADFPVIGNQLRRNVHALGGNGIALAVGLLVLVWGSLGVAYAAQHATAQIWGVPVHQRPNFGARVGRAMLLLATLAVGVIGTTVLSGAVAGIGGGLAFDLGGVALALAVNAALYFVGLRVLTPAPVPSRDLLPGAVLGGVAWTILQFFGSWLVARQLRHTSELYGFFAIVLGLMFWLYLAAQILVYVSEVDVVLARRLWPRSVAPPPLTDADKDTLAALARAQARRSDERVHVTFDDGEDAAEDGAGYGVTPRG
jgi:YihY family inner membrane protein